VRRCICDGQITEDHCRSCDCVNGVIGAHSHGNPAQNQMPKAAQVAMPKYQTDARIISMSSRDSDQTRDIIFTSSSSNSCAVTLTRIGIARMSGAVELVLPVS